ncbi:MAG: tetratricopeptide repeat protein [Butyrivibrio sp.]|nr:tetratricopeptide repeat protein [Butyrivibrio sp.]
MTGALLCLLLGMGAGCGSRETAHIDAATAALQIQDFETAATELAIAEENGENARERLRSAGISQLMQGDPSAAVESLLASFSGSIGWPDAMDYDTNYYLAEAYLKQGSYSEAAAVYDAILGLKPNEVTATRLRGAAELAGGDYDRAITDFHRAIQLAPRDYDQLIAIYRMLADAGYEEEGAALLQRAQDAGISFMTNYEKGQIAYYLGKNAEAQSYLEQARNERDADKAPAVALLGQTAEKQGDYNYAVSVYRTFLTEDSAHPEIWNQLGLCLIRMGDYEGAIDAFEAGLALEDNSYDQALTRNEILAYEESGAFTQARVRMEQYLHRWPDDEEAAREYIFLSTR